MRLMIFCLMLLSGAAAAEDASCKAGKPPAHSRACKADADCALVTLQGSCCDPRHFAVALKDAERVRSWAAACGPPGVCDMVCPEPNQVVACVSKQCRVKELKAAPPGK